MHTNAKKIRIGGVSHDIEDTQARTDISALKSSMSSKADLDGYYEDMSVGSAEQLISSVLTEDSVPYKFRTSGGSSDIGNRAYMDKIVGGTVAWNQLVTNGNFASSTGWKQTDITATISNNQAALTATAQWGRLSYSSASTLIAGHKYLFSAEMKGTTSNSMNVNYGQQDSKYLNVDNTWVNVSFIKAPQSSSYYSISFGDKSASDFATFYVKNVMVFDLTQMFGSTVADYIYTLEQSTDGAGVAFFRSLFPNSYYEYNAGELISVSGLQSHDTVGFNAWDEEWEIGFWNQQGEKDIASTAVRSTNYIRVIPGANYYIKTPYNLIIRRFDAQKVLVGTIVIQGDNKTLSIPADTSFIVFCSYTSDNITSINPGDICINLSHSGARNGEYEPYSKHSYPLDSSLTLRGVPKLDSSNNLYWDGDEYAPDGTVTRRYGIVDLGTLEWGRHPSIANTFFTSGGGSTTFDTQMKTGSAFITTKYPFCGTFSSYDTFADKTAYSSTSLGRVGIKDTSYSTVEDFKAALSGVYLVYEIITPTTETADAYQQIQNVDDYGTEEFVSTSIVPVGHVTRYPANLRDKLQHFPDLAASDGTYVILQSGSQMTLAPLTTPTELPAAPSANGTYTLKATVSNGAVTYSWGT